jgi:hypothetical protein
MVFNLILVTSVKNVYAAIFDVDVKDKERRKRAACGDTLVI